VVCGVWCVVCGVQLRAGRAVQCVSYHVCANAFSGQSGGGLRRRKSSVGGFPERGVSLSMRACACVYLPLLYPYSTHFSTITLPHYTPQDPSTTIPLLGSLQRSDSVDQV
jgi:hypothetical protein